MNALDDFSKDPNQYDKQMARQRVRLHKQNRALIDGEIEAWRQVLMVHGTSTADADDHQWRS